jgi:hypothetical protein
LTRVALAAAAEAKGFEMDKARRMAEYPTLASAVDGLTRRGFTEHFRAVDGGLRVLDTGETLRSEDLVIREVHRFEGISDPGDMAVVYAVESKSGLRGTLTDAFGVYADPAMGTVLEDISIRAAIG